MFPSTYTTFQDEGSELDDVYGTNIGIGVEYNIQNMSVYVCVCACNEMTLEREREQTLLSQQLSFASEVSLAPVTPSNMAGYISLPAPLRQFFSLFPLYTHPTVSSPYTAKKITAPTIWVHPPRDPDADLLSSDVECLKWQAYLALRGLTDVVVRWDVSVDGALESRLPNLHVPLKEGEDGGGELLPAHLIPEWADSHLSSGQGELEGYIDEAARDESRAWVALMEGKVHAALVRIVASRAYISGKLILICFMCFFYRCCHSSSLFRCSRSLRHFRQNRVLSRAC